MSLTTTAHYSRIGIKVSIALFFSYYLFTGLIWPLTKNAWYKAFPPKDLPTLAYGKLPEIKFTKVNTVGNNYITYTLNTKNGALPTTFPKKLPVFKFQPPLFSYSAKEEASKQAESLGFNDTTDRLTDLKGNTLRWYNNEALANLQIDTQSKALLLTVPIENKSYMFPQGSIKRAEIANNVRNILTALNRFNDPLYQGGYQNTYSGKFQGNRIVNSEFELESQIGRVDFFRMIGQYPIYGPDPQTGLIQVIVTKPNDPQAKKMYTYPKINYFYKEINQNRDATYPLYSVADAWKAVTEGKGFIASVIPIDYSMFQPVEKQKVERVLVNNVRLGYFEPVSFEPFLQPIYIFSGNYTSAGTSGGNITIYYPAITAENYVETTTDQINQFDQSTNGNNF